MSVPYKSHKKTIMEIEYRQIYLYQVILQWLCGTRSLLVCLDQTVIVVDRNFSLHIGGAARRKTSEVEPLSQSQVFWLLYYIGDRGQVFCLPRGLPARRLRGWHAFYYLIYTKRLDMGRSRKWGVPDQHVHRGGVSFSHVNSSSFLKISQQLQAEHYINPT